MLIESLGPMTKNTKIGDLFLLRLWGSGSCRGFTEVKACENTAFTSVDIVGAGGWEMHKGLGEGRGDRKGVSSVCV